MDSIIFPESSLMNLAALLRSISLTVTSVEPRSLSRKGRTSCSK